MLPARDFLKLFGELEIRRFFRPPYRWTRGLVEQVRRNEIEGVTFEGVVGKGQERQSDRLWPRLKRKTGLI